MWPLPSTTHRAGHHRMRDTPRGWEPSAEELAELNKETDELVAHLAANGITVEVENDELGIRFPVFDENTDEATWELVDEFFAERYGDELPEDCGEVVMEFCPPVAESA